MNEQKFNSQVCTTIEQSQRLLELGLKLETADMCYIYKPKHLADTTPEEDWVLKVSSPVGTDIPAWSLHRLMEIAEMDCFNSVATAYDEVISMIKFEYEEGYINKEYLK